MRPPAPNSGAGRQRGRRLALRAGRKLARALARARRAPDAAPACPTPFEFVREVASSSFAGSDPKPLRVRLREATRFEFVSDLERASSSISEREAARLFARAYTRSSSSL